MKFSLSSIKINHFDKKKEIKFPNKINPELAEFIGIMTGDGHIRYKKRINSKGHKSTVSDLIISGNKKEKDYLDYVNNLFTKIFNYQLKYFIDNRSNAVYLMISSAGIVKFLNKCCELPLNKKDNIKISRVIMNSNNKVNNCGLKSTAFSEVASPFQVQKLIRVFVLSYAVD